MATRKDNNFIDYRKRGDQYRRSYARFIEDDNVIAENKEIIKKFLRDCELGKTLRGRQKKKISESRCLRLLEYLKSVSAWMGKPLDKVEEKDMEDFILNLEKDIYRKKNGKPYSEETKSSIKKVLKKFYRWMYGEGDRLNKLMGWVETFVPEKEIPTLRREEVELLAQSSGDMKYNFVIMLLFDSGARIEEIMNVRLKDISRKKDYYAIRIIYSKTKPRTISLPICSELMEVYLRNHHGKDDPMSPLLTMKEAALRMYLKRLSMKVLKKRVTPHTLRHASASYYCNRLSQYQLCYRYGWSMASKMPARYIDREGILEQETAKAVREDDMASLSEKYKCLKEAFICQQEKLDRINSFMEKFVAEKGLK